MRKKQNIQSSELSYIWLYVKDTKTSIRFYRDVLGFKIAETFPHGALFYVGSILLGVHREEGIRKSQPGSTVLILRTNNIDKTYKDLQTKGLLFDREIKQEPYGKIVPFKDPDGYHWELVEEPKS
ncbi:VOC family protein [candidate division WWE3 bacterium]|nr:VOC family protein [candidate division WWE3 bacterium]